MRVNPIVRDCKVPGSSLERDFDPCIYLQMLEFTEMRLDLSYINGRMFAKEFCHNSSCNRINTKQRGGVRNRYYVYQQMSKQT